MSLLNLVLPTRKTKLFFNYLLKKATALLLWREGGRGGNLVHSQTNMPYGETRRERVRTTQALRDAEYLPWDSAPDLVWMRVLTSSRGHEGIKKMK